MRKGNNGLVIRVCGLSREASNCEMLIVLFSKKAETKRGGRKEHVRKHITWDLLVLFVFSGFYPKVSVFVVVLMSKLARFMFVIFLRKEVALVCSK